MKKSNRYNGMSDYQNKKRIAKQQGKDCKVFKSTLAPCESDYPNVRYKDNDKPILIMLDLQGTLDGLCDETARKFISLLSKLEKKLKASNVFVSFSTHDTDPTVIKFVGDILARNNFMTISFTKSFYLNGTYDYDSNKATFEKEQFNLSKLDNFREFIKQEFDEDLAWVGIFDDSAHDTEIYKYKDKMPMALFRPSQNTDDVSKYDNLMCHSTKTHGINGVIEMLSDYISQLDEIKNNDILKEQRNALFKFHNSQLLDLCDNNIDLLIRYLKETELDKETYTLIETYIGIRKNAGGENLLYDEVLGLIEKITISKYLR